jgi:uncharacterized membrane protein YphA (DoxX/SURF4 family)
MTVVVVWLRLLLLGVFLEALYSHLRRPERLQRVIVSLGLPSASLLAVVVTAADALVCVCLVVVPSLGGAAALTYIVLVTVAVWVARRVGREVVDCGCSANPEPPDAGFYARNLVLLVTSAAVSVTAQPELTELAGVLALSAYAIHRSVRLALTRLMTPHGRAMLPRPVDS